MLREISKHETSLAIRIVIMKKLFKKNDHCDHCDNCDYTSFYSGHLNKHKKGKHDEVKLDCD